MWAEITKVGSVQRPLINTQLVTTFEPGSPHPLQESERQAHLWGGPNVEVVEPTLFSHT
ncbi:MAG: hypothetical protein WA880_01555 [Ornithinimicrobium sp.]